jgi:hypothetical protein
MADPSALTISVTVTSWSLYLARTSLACCSGESLAGRPQARAAAEGDGEGTDGRFHRMPYRVFP